MPDLSTKVRSALQGLDLKSPQIDVQGSTGSIIATVVSGSFTGMDEAERQKQVWGALRSNLSDEESLAVEFVFTIAPEEQEPAEEAV